MTKKVLFVLMALFSYVGAWAQDGQTVDQEVIVREPVAAIYASADAEEPINTYYWLEEALSACQEGQIVKLIDHALVEGTNYQNGQIVIKKGHSVILDLNGFSIKPIEEFARVAAPRRAATLQNTGLFRVEFGASLTIDDSSNDGTGLIDATANQGGEEGFYYTVGIMLGQADPKAEDDGTQVAKLIVNGGTIKGLNFGISGNGNTSPTGTTWLGTTYVEINGGTISATSDEDGTGIYQPGVGVMTINGGKINGFSSAVEVRSGNVDVTINGGELEAYSAVYSVVANGNGTTTKGAAFAVAQHTTNNDIAIAISGGTFKGTKSLSIANPQHNLLTNVAVDVTGGAFDGPVIVAGDVPEAFDQKFLAGGIYTEAPNTGYVAEGYTIVDNEDATYKKKVVPATDTWTWTMQPTSGKYNGLAQYPAIKVFEKDLNGNRVPVQGGYLVKYFANKATDQDGVVSFSATDFETAEEVDEMRHAGSYFVQVYYDDAVNEDEQGEPVFKALPGDPKTFTISKYTIEIALQKIDLQYGTKVTDLEPVYQINPKQNDKTLEQTIEGTGIDRYSYEVAGLGGVRADGGWTEDALIPGSTSDPIYNYALTSSTSDYRVYVKECLYDEYGEAAGVAYYNNYDPVTLSRQSAYVNSVKGELTIIVDAESFRKEFGRPDPDYNETDADGTPLHYTAKNQSGDDVPVTLYRPDYKVKDVEAKPMEQASTADEIDPRSEAIGDHELAIDLSQNQINGKPIDTFYNITFVYEDRDETPVLNIYPYDITRPDPKPDPEPGPEPGPDPTPEPEDLFEATIADVVYTAEKQYPDAVMVFHHQVLGDIVLSKTNDEGKLVGYADADLSTLREVVLREKFTNFTKELSYNKWTLGGTNPSGNIHESGSYTNQQDVVRDETTAPYAAVAGAGVEIRAIEAADNRFTGSRTVPFKITPAALPVKVAENTAEFSGAQPNFGIALNAEEWPVEKEASAVQAQILTAVGDAVFAYDPDGEYGYVYDGTVGSETTVGVKAEAQSAKNVILAAKNYTLTFAEGKNTITAIALAFKVENQTRAYPAPVGNTYSKPEIDATVAGNITLTSGTLPAGMSVADFFDKVVSNGNTMVGKQSEVLDGVMSEEATKPIYNITVAKGDLTITPLNELHLGYDNIKQALYDHQGDLKTKLSGVAGYEDYAGLTVYLPARQMKADNWYEWVLPFATTPRDFFYPIIEKDADNNITGVQDSRWQYGAINTLDLEKTKNGNVVFDVEMGGIAANTPFLVKIDELISAADMEKVNFTGVQIAEFDYVTKQPTTGSLAANGVQFVGLYEDYTIKADDTNKMIMLQANGHDCREFWKAGPATAGKVTLTKTKAYLEFPSEAAADGARIFIEEADGTMTAIKAIGAPTEFEAPSKVAEGWYTVNGMKLDAAPTQKGTYIFNGKKVYVK